MMSSQNYKSQAKAQAQALSQSNFNYPKTYIEIMQANSIEKSNYIYHGTKDTGKWVQVKELCNWSYALHDNNYLGDMLDNYLYNGRVFDESKRLENENIIQSYEFLYRNVSSIVIKYKDNKTDSNIVDGLYKTLQLTGPEMRYFLENFKMPTTTKRQQSYYNYFKSFIFSNVYPESYKTQYDFTIQSMEINMEDENTITMDEL